MTSFEFKLGTEVHCQDKDCGKLAKVVVDPETEQVTDLIVERGLINTADRVVPMSAVQEATERAVRLAISSDELDALPEYRQEEVVVPAAVRDIRPGQTFEQVTAAWQANYGLGLGALPGMPAIRQRVHEGIPSDETVIERGVTVENVDGPVGKVDHVLVDRATMEITHLVVDPGLFSASIVIPGAMITGIDESGVSVQGTNEGLKNLARYTHRPSDEIEAGVQERFAASGQDYGDVRVTAASGMVRLAGTVASEQARLQAAQIARSVDGVIDVDNVLAVR